MNPSLNKYSQLLRAYLRPQSSRVLLLALLLFSGIALQLFNPQVIRFFIDTASTNATASIDAAASSGNLNPLLWAALLFIAVALIGRGIALTASYLASNVGWTATNALRADLTLHCLRLDMPFHKQHTPGELIERIDGDVTSLANFFSQLLIQVVGNVALVLGILLLLFREDLWAGIGLTLYSGVTFLLLSAIQNIAVRRWTVDRQAHAELYGFLEERITGAEDIRSSGAEAYVMNRLYLLLRRMLGANRSARLVSNLAFTATKFLYVTGYALGLALGAFLYTHGQVTIGSAFIIVYYIGMLSEPLEAIRTQLQDLQTASASIDRVNELLSLQSRVQANTTDAGAHLPHGALKVTFQGVSFAYDDAASAAASNHNGTESAPGELVLSGVSFHLGAGKVLGLLGRTGSGKTTLSRLLYRLYDPTHGTITLNARDLRALAAGELSQRVGMVTQDVQLFHATVRDNLTFFNRSIPDGQLERILKDLRLWEWVQSLPQGLDTPLAAGGQGLSAGEAQLLAFTRLFLKDPGLVILDEASSRLDPVTEARLERVVERLFQNRTGIIIAHRLQTVQRVDDILILENGAVIEYGARQSLAADADSHFHRLLQTGLEEVLA